jgi:hypothetical protein
MNIGAIYTRVMDISFLLSLNEIQLGLKIGFVQNNTLLGATAFDQVLPLRSSKLKFDKSGLPRPGTTHIHMKLISARLKISSCVSLMRI